MALELLHPAPSSFTFRRDVSLAMIDHHVEAMTVNDQDPNHFLNDRCVRGQPFGSFCTFRGVNHPVRLVEAYERRPDRSEQSPDEEYRAQG